MRRLRKSERNRVLFGVAAGLSEYFEVDPALVRVGFAGLCFAGGIGFLLYIALAVVMPRADAPEGSPADAVGDNVEHLAEDAAEAGRRPGAAVGPATAERRRNALGVLLIAIGRFILLTNPGLFFWWRWDIFWAALLIGVGFVMVARRARPSP